MTLFATKMRRWVALGTLAVAGCGESAKPGGGAGSAGQAGSSGSGGAGSGASGGSSTGGSDASGGAIGGSGRDGTGGASGAAGATPGRGGAGGAGGVAGGMSGSAGFGAAGASAGSGAAGASGGSASGGSAGAASVDCSGRFGKPRVVLDPGPKIRLYSPTLSADELELLYSATDAEGSKAFRRSTRSSKLDAFEPGTPLPELDAACALTDDRTLDLTTDGLRVYIVCYDPIKSFSGPLRVARRSARGAPFVLDAQSYGTVGASPAIAADELSLYTSGFNASTSPGLLFMRFASNAPFDDHGFAIPGLDGLPTTAPDISVNSLALFFERSYGVWVATRESPEAPFSTPQAVIEAPADAPASSSHSAAISDDCRSLYAVRYVSDAGAGDPSWTLEVLTR